MFDLYYGITETIAAHTHSSILNAYWKMFKCGKPTYSRQVQEIASDFRHFHYFMNDTISGLKLKVAIWGTNNPAHQTP